MASEDSVPPSYPADKVFSDHEDFEKHLPMLKASLEDEDRSVRMQVVQSMLGECLSLCPPNLIGEKVLDFAIPVAQQLFFESFVQRSYAHSAIPTHKYPIHVGKLIYFSLNLPKMRSPIERLEEIDIILGDATLEDLDVIKSQLGVCGCLLECWQQCLKHIEGLQRISASYVKVLPERVAQLIKRSFEHLKTRDAYGILFEEATEQLTSLFRKTNAVQTLFFEILEKIVLFDRYVELEVMILANVVSTIGEIGVLVNGMDTKTWVQVWRTFGNLASDHCDDLKYSSAACVTLHLKTLASNVTSLLQMAIKDPDEKQAEKFIKCGNLFLKILQKLCTSYSGYLGVETAMSVVQLLLQIHRYSPPCLKIQDVKMRLINCIKAHITIGAEPFLSSIFDDADFKQAFFEYKDHGKTVDIGYHILTLNIIKKLIAMPHEFRRAWLEPPRDILDVALTNINFCQEELCNGQLRLTGYQQLGEQPRQATLYEATLVSISGLLLHIPESDFHFVELLLLKHLLGGQFWGSLLASDVWCFVARFGSSELSYDHLVYLMDVYVKLAKREKSFEAVMLCALIARLYTLLPKNMKNSFTKKIETDNALAWAAVTRVLTPNANLHLSERVSIETTDIRKLLTDLDEKPSAANWSNLVNQLRIIGTIGQDQSENVIGILRDIWIRIATAIGELEGIYLYLLNDLTIALFDGTRTLKICDEVFSEFLSSMASIIPYAAPCVRIRMCHYLTEIVHNFDNSGSELVAAVSEIYCCLLEDETPWVRQEAYESFNRVAHASPNDDLVGGIIGAVQRRPLISDSLPAYLSNTPHYQLSGFPSTQAYLESLIRESRNAMTDHTCFERDVRERLEKRPKFETEEIRDIPTEQGEELEKRVNRLCEEIDSILMLRKHLLQRSLEKLRVAASKIRSVDTPMLE